MHVRAHSLRVRRRRALLGALLVAGTMAATGCTPHRVAVNYKCPGVTAHKTVVFSSRRGGTGMAKVGVTPAGLKAEQKCQATS
jgi:hypothetical protein